MNSMLTTHDLHQIQEILDETLDRKLDQKLEEKLEEKLTVKLQQQKTEILSEVQIMIKHSEQNITNQIHNLSDKVVEFVTVVDNDFNTRISNLEKKASFIVRDK